MRCFLATWLRTPFQCVPAPPAATPGRAGTRTQHARAQHPGAEVGLDAHRAACRELLAMSHAERAALPYMHPGRVDVIGAGALIWHELVSRVAEVNGPDLPVVTSEKDILDGIAFSAAARG